MRWEGHFTVPGRADDLIVLFDDPVLMARYLPGAEVDSVEPDGSVNGAITVRFGPKRLKFRGIAIPTIDRLARTGSVEGRGASDVRGARFKVRMDYALTDTGTETNPQVRVSLVSVAELQGPLAEIARTGGPIVAGAILDEFARRLRDDLENPDAAPPATGDNALSAWKIARSAIARAVTRRDGGDRERT